MANVNRLGEMHGIVGRAWCYDRCMYILTTDALHMEFDVISTIYTYSSQCTSNSAATQICQWYLRNLYRYVMKAGIIAKQQLQ